MRAMLRDMKWNSFVSLLRFFIVLGGMGIASLVYHWSALMQLLGLKPMVDEIKKDEVITLSIIGAAMLLFVLFLLLRVLSGSLQKRVKEFMAHLDEGEKEKLVWDYQNAWRGSRTIRVGTWYTFVCDDGTRIFRNRDIIWIYPWCEKTRYSQNYYLSVYLIDTEKPEQVGTKKKDSPKILEYFERNFPHMVIGCSDEADFYYKNYRNQFLNLRYYNEENRPDELFLNDK